MLEEERENSNKITHNCQKLKRRIERSLQSNQNYLLLSSMYSKTKIDKRRFTEAHVFLVHRVYMYC